MARVSRRFRKLRRPRGRLLLSDLGSTRHILLIGLVGMCLVAALHWQGRVSCLFEGAAFNMRASSGVVIAC